jgi:hypothetical protein
MVWDGMTQEEQVIAQTVISGEKDLVIWRMKPVKMLPGTESTKKQRPSLRSLVRG